MCLINFFLLKLTRYQIRSSGTQASNEDIIKYSKLFKNELTLDSMSRLQLVALCRLLLITPYGTDNFLRFQLRLKLRQLKSDDMVRLLIVLSPFSVKSFPFLFLTTFHSIIFTAN